MMTEEQKRWAAIHEAAHAVAFTLLGGGVEYAVIGESYTADGLRRGGMTIPVDGKTSFVNYIICLMAGEAVDLRFGMDEGEARGRAEADYREAADLMNDLSPEQIENICFIQRGKAAELIAKNIDKILAVAMYLREHGRIEGAEVQAIISNPNVAAIIIRANETPELKKFLQEMAIPN